MEHMQAFNGRTFSYTNPFEGKSIVSHEVDSSQLVWTPDGMTTEQAIAQLPPCCRVHLTVPPCLFTLKWLQHLHRCSADSGCHDAASSISRCIVTGYRMLPDEDKKIVHALAVRSGL